jgi:glutathione peroxidase
MKFWASMLLGALVMNIQAGDQPSLYEIPLKTIDGKATSLKDYEGDVLLVVNVASQCGLTPQYEGLQSVFSKYQEKGLKVLGFPCNDFGAQEPGTNDEIKVFCTSKYEVSFPMFDKLHVKGNEQHPLYAALTGKKSPFPGDIEWNFGKFLIDRNGKILKRFNPRTEPGSEEITNAIEAALKQ